MPLKFYFRKIYVRIKLRKYHYNCSICGSDSFFKIYGVSIFNVCVCRNCGLVCLNPRMDEKGYEEYYKNQYFGSYQSKVEIDKPYNDIKEGSREAEIFNNLKQYVTPTSKIIEIGCGEGTNLVIFKKKGFNNLAGLEPASDCCERLQNFYEIRCIKNTLLEFIADFNEDKFDCVILSHVVEHFVEPEKALKAISRIIKPQGFLYIRAPNFYGFFEPFSQFSTPHTFYFSNVTLKMLLRNSGFMVEKSFESSAEEIVLLAKKSNDYLTSTGSNQKEYEKVLSYLKKDKLIYIKMRIKRTIEELIITLFGGNIYLSIRNFFKKIKMSLVN